MYYDYFGLKQPPFRITPDTSLFFPGGNRGAILNAMIYAITSGEGIVKVVGEVGSGKTMLCRMLTVELPDNVEVVYLANPSLSPDNILHAIAFELKLAVNPQDDRLRVMQSLQQYLLKRHSENRQVVVFVEEAQSMPIATLEEIRLLSNLETKQHKLLQIVLFGQPELDQMIARKEIRQLKERITYSFTLNPLKVDEARDYINTRLRACGCRYDEVFTNSAIRGITSYSNGLLRRINILADKAMLSAYASNKYKVTAKDVRVAARDSEFVVGWQRFRYAITIISLVMVVILAGVFTPYEKIFSLLDQDKNQPEKELLDSDVAAQEKSVTINEIRTKPKVIQEDNVATRYLPQDDSQYYDFLSKGTAPDNNDTIDDSAHNVELNPQVVEKSGENNNISRSEDSRADSGMVHENNRLADYLLDQEHYAQIIEVGDSSLTSEEAEILLQQLKLLPPETTHTLERGTECRLCTSIIYRPLMSREKL